MAGADNKANRWSGDAFVPGRWVEKDIKYMEIDTPHVVLIDPSREQGTKYGSEYRLWVNEHNRPMLSGNVPMPDSGRDFDSADLVGSHFGVMRTFEQMTGELREGFVVDLRYANPGDVPQVDTSVVPDDQEELNGWLEFLNAAIPVAAVVVSKHEGVVMDPELKQKKPKKGKEGWEDDEVERDYTVYGNAAFYPALDYLIAALDKEIIIAQKNAKKADKERARKQEEKPEHAKEEDLAKEKVANKLGKSGTVLANFFRRFS